MTTLADIRDRLRRDLHDTDPGSYRWSDEQLDRHIERALHDLSLAMPREATATVVTTPGSREVSLASLDGLIEVEAVEFPAGLYPPAEAGFSRWADALLLQTAVAPMGEDAKLFYTARHTLDEDGTTLPAAFTDILATGAAGFAAVELASFTVDRLNTGGGSVAEQYAAWGRAWLMAFRELLRIHGRRGRLGKRRLVRSGDR